MPAQQTIFTPSSSGTNAIVTMIASSLAVTTGAMPAVDAANLDTLVVNSSSTPCFLAFGVTPTPAGPNVVGNVLVQPGQSVLLTAKGGVLSAAASNPAVIGPPQASTAASATLVSATAGLPGQISLTITRGTAAANYVF